MVDKYEDPFVRIASMIGGDEYLKVARSLLKAEDATDEEIASSTGLRINMVRKVLYDLFGKSLITGIRVKDDLVANDYLGLDGKANPHKSYGYLRTPELSKCVKEFLDL